MVQEAENHRDKNKDSKTKIMDENGPENHYVTVRSTSIVEKLKSKFDVGHRRETEEAAHARNRSDKNRWQEKRGFEGKQKGRQIPQDAQERANLTNQRHFPFGFGLWSTRDSC